MIQAKRAPEPAIPRPTCTTRGRSPGRSVQLLFIPYKSPEHSVQLASGGEAICPRGSVQELGNRAETSGRTILWAQPSSPDAPRTPDLVVSVCSELVRAVAGKIRLPCRRCLPLSVGQTTPTRQTKVCGRFVQNGLATCTTRSGKARSSARQNVLATGRELYKSAWGWQAQAFVLPESSCLFGRPA